MICVTECGDRAAQFRLPVHLNETRVRPGRERPMQQGQRHGRGPVHDVAQARDRGVRRLAGVKEPGDHGWDEERVGRAGPHRTDKGGGVGFAGHDRRHPARMPNSA